MKLWTGAIPTSPASTPSGSCNPPVARTALPARDSRSGRTLDCCGVLAGWVLGAALSQDGVVPAGRLQRELAVAVEERFARSDLPHGIGRSDVCTRWREYLHPGLDDFACCGITYFACDLWHDVPFGSNLCPISRPGPGPGSLGAISPLACYVSRLANFQQPSQRSLAQLNANAGAQAPRGRNRGNET